MNPTGPYTPEELARIAQGETVPAHQAPGFGGNTTIGPTAPGSAPGPQYVPPHSVAPLNTGAGAAAPSAGSATTPSGGSGGADPTPMTLPPSISGLNQAVGSNDISGGLGAGAVNSAPASVAGLMGEEALRPLGWRRVPAADGLALGQKAY